MRRAVCKRIALCAALKPVHSDIAIQIDERYFIGRTLMPNERKQKDSANLLKDSMLIGSGNVEVLAYYWQCCLPYRNTTVLFRSNPDAKRERNEGAGWVFEGADAHWREL